MDVVLFADDRQEYLDLLSQSDSKHALDFLAWCLMSNHAHFVGLSRQEVAPAHVRRSALQFSVKVGR
jgi:REP element-mobilizing transposase RayT